MNKLNVNFITYIREKIKNHNANWKLDLSVQSIVFLILGILCNILGMSICGKFELPFLLNSFGTVFVAMVLGPVAGMIVGGVSGVILLTFGIINVIYLIINVLIGLVAGIAVTNDKGADQAYEKLKLVLYILIIALVISVPVNMLFREGYTGNTWGNAVFDLCTSRGLSVFISSLLSTLFVEFPDKLLSMAIASLFCKGVGSMNNKKTIDKIRFSGIFLGAIISLALFNGTALKASAEEKFILSDYDVSAFGQEACVSIRDINSIIQTEDGYIWIGTYDGLMMYDGKEFKIPEACQGITDITTLHESNDGWIWIGTNGSGVAKYRYSTGDVEFFTKNEGLSSNSIKSIVEDEFGNIIVGTAAKVSIIRVDKRIITMSDASSVGVTTHLCANPDNSITGLTNQGVLFKIEDTTSLKDVHVMKNPFGNNEAITCMDTNGNGTIIVATAKGKLYKIDENSGNGLTQFADVSKVIGTSSVSYIKYDSSTEGWFFGGSNSIGYVSSTGSVYDMSVSEYSNASSDAIRDKQGNIWVTSSKNGICKYSKNSLKDIFAAINCEDDTVNAITNWNGYMLYGCDGGLIVTKEGQYNKVTINELNFLDGCKISDLYEDSKKNLWISTYDRGVVCVSKDLNVVEYNKSNSSILGNNIRFCVELQDGTILVASNLGLTYLKDGNTIATLGENNGLKVPQILSVVETSDGKILAASDGDGIYEIREAQIVGHINAEDGLDSLVVSKIVPYNDGYFYVTSNAIYYNDGTNINKLDNFPYSNNYDILLIDERVVVPGNIGICIVKLSDLIENKENYPYILLDEYRGFDTSAMDNAKNYCDADKQIYLCTVDGVVAFSLDNLDDLSDSYNIRISRVLADKEICYADADGNYTIPEGTSRISISPAILNFKLVNPLIHIYLEGFEKEGVYVNQQDLQDMVYTNLSYGNYKLHIEVLDEMTGEVRRQSTFNIFKDACLYETTYFRIYLVIVILAFIIYITWLVTKHFSISTILKQKHAIETAKEESEKSFEALRKIAAIVDAKDKCARAHSARVADYSCLLAEKLGWSPKYIAQLRYGALLHDIGNVGLEDRLLNKNGTLTDDEYKIVKQHAAIGGDILKNMTYFADAAQVARHHHERYDGTGYPDGLAGNEIPQAARVVSIAEAYDAMSSKKLYRKPLDRLMIRKELLDGKGSQFDPEYVDAFLELFDKGMLNPTIGNKQEEKIIPDSFLDTVMLGSNKKTTELMISQMVNTLQESGEYSGALGIEYYEFSRLHEFILSLAKRYYFSGHLVLMTLNNRYEMPLTDDEYNVPAVAMEKAICDSLRSTDAFTRISRNQFMVIMIEAGEENIQMVVKRMTDAFYSKYTDNRVEVSYDVVEINNEQRKNKNA